MAECKFCESLENHKKIENFWLEEGNEPSKYEYSVLIQMRCWKPKYGKKDSSWDIDYGNRKFGFHGLGYKLNYCPECGKDLRNG